MGIVPLRFSSKHLAHGSGTFCYELKSDRHQIIVQVLYDQKIQGENEALSICVMNKDATDGLRDGACCDLTDSPTRAVRGRARARLAENRNNPQKGPQYRLKDKRNRTAKRKDCD